ncbi:hypothetical protein [Psittacicella hinzii]|uniref:Uncharacterized protein n=1 Tax=Psittacicella hinzii TaxID=2028575 RepID=A0A3A1YVC0_9GAMM|nr:hypothetical protein [Psittacicella hinzii]RIY40007.1 hypothetical protein CKF58_01190 [Psittacicella hinzii]
MFLIDVVLKALMHISISLCIIFVFVILPLYLLSRKVKLVRRYRRIKRVNETVKATPVSPVEAIISTNKGKSAA